MASLSTGESYSYDANGNMLTRVENGSTYTQTFDAENRLISVTVNSQTTQFVYDGDGNLVKKINPDNSKTLYVGGLYEVNKNAGGTVTRNVTYYPMAGAMRINVIGGSNTVYYLLKDHLGSASTITDMTGNVLGDLRYYPYGETRLATGSILTDRLYTGQREITGLGIYHYGARFYSQKLGRFLSPDTIVPNPANPQDLNRFSYVRNNPIRYTDPSGHAVANENDGGCRVRNCGLSTNPQRCTTNCPTTAGGGGGGGGGGNNNSGDDGGGGEITISLIGSDVLGPNGECDASCQFKLTMLGVAGTGADVTAALLNVVYAGVTDVAFFVNPAAFGALEAGYRAYSFIPNTIASLGGAIWSFRDIQAGNTFLVASVSYTRSDSGISLNQIGLAGSLGQDTIFSVANDFLGWGISEPNVATLWSAIGAVYDLERNPLSPGVSTAPPIFPTVVQPYFNLSYDFSTSTGSTSVGLSP